MKRTLALIAVALLAPTLLAGAAKKPAARDWTTTVGRTPDGAYVVGNPAAKVKLVEYASYTCPHCAHFAGEAEPALRDTMIKTGTVSLTFRHAIRDKLDLTAALLARCTRTGFLATSDAIFAAQEDWYPRGGAFAQNNDARLSKYPEAARLRAYADGSGLTALVKTRGLSDTAIDACLANPAELATIPALADDAWSKIKGTPSFAINGKPVDGGTWDAIAPQLRAAGAK